jgi:DUF4097 and DUF4098 domain-containing protein YvlB
MQPYTYPSSEARAMRRFILFVVVLTAVVISGAIVPRSRRGNHIVVAAQQAAGWHSDDCEDNSQKRWSHWGESHVCQMRRTTFALPAGRLTVDTTNGGIDVTGEDRSDVALEARVQAWAPSDSAASDLLRQIVIDTTSGDVRDHGPHPSFFGHTGYSIDYRLHVPRHLSADLHTMNGGIDLARLDGPIRFHTTNGGVNLDELSGDVEGSTVNGGLGITLIGDHWQGAGLHADTTNGGVDLRLPEHYSAHLETGTVNGGVSVNFPITIQGSIKSHLNTDLGSGGPTIHVQTVNGGVSVSHSDAPGVD